MKKQIWDYFHSTVDYPKNKVHFPIPYGTMWAYISSTYLNGFINYVRPISVFVLDRYTPKDEDITDRKNNLCRSAPLHAAHRHDPGGCSVHRRWLTQ